MSVDLASADAIRVNNTTPLVEPDGAGGHVPYVRLDTTPGNDYPAAEAAILDVLRETLEVLKTIRDESRAARLGIEELLNAGNQTQHNLLEMALAASDKDEVN